MANQKGGMRDVGRGLVFAKACGGHSGLKMRRRMMSLPRYLSIYLHVYISLQTYEVHNVLRSRPWSQTCSARKRHGVGFWPGAGSITRLLGLLR